MLPEHVPQGERHGDDAEDEVGPGQGDDEDVPGRAHLGLAQDGGEDDYVAGDPDEDDDAVEGEENDEDAPADALLLGEVLREVLEHLQDALARVIAAGEKKTAIFLYKIGTKF